MLCLDISTEEPRTNAPQDTFENDPDEPAMFFGRIMRDSELEMLALLLFTIHLHWFRNPSQLSHLTYQHTFQTTR